MTRRTREAIGYVNAGGRGTRLCDLFAPNEKTGVAKALLAIGTPQIRLVDHHINNLQQQGINTIVIATGDQREVFEYVNDVYADIATVTATKSTQQLGTGGDLVKYARDYGQSKDILVQNVDTILDIDLAAFIDEADAQARLGRIATIALTLSRGVPNEDAYAVEEGGKVRYSGEFSDLTSIDDGMPTSYRGSSTGAVVIDADFLRQSTWRARENRLSLYRDVLKDAWEANGLFAYNNGTKFFRDIGTAATWLASQDDEELQRHLNYNPIDLMP